MVLALGDVARHQKVGAIGHLLFVHGLDGVFGCLALLEGDVALVGERVTFIARAVHISRLNFTVLSKHSLELVVARALRQALDEQVEEALFRLGTLLLPLMVQNLDFLPVELERARLLDGQVGGLLAFELDVSEASRLAVGEEFKLTRADGSEGEEGIVELLLRDRKINELDDQVSLGLHEVALLEVAADVVRSNLRVVHLRGAAAGFCGIEELEETVAVLALGLLVNVDDRLVDVVTHPLHVLV